MFFISLLKPFSFSRYLTFCLDILAMLKNKDEKVKVNLKSYEVRTWETNTCNTHFAQYLNK